MVKNIFLVLLLVVSFSAVAQEQVFIEAAGRGYFKFHFDQQYFLVDKNCEFLSIVRVSRINEHKQFEGDFTDYDLDGNTVLTGNYASGKKTGTFKAYHPNGFLKWQGDFLENEPHGTWNFYYPNGKAKTILQFKDARTYLLESWNAKGKQMVKNGQGRFELKDFVFGYNDIGHEAFLYSGKVSNGLPQGMWSIEYAFPDGETETYAAPVYDDGLTPTAFTVKYAETEAFENAENLFGKTCSIDEHINFTRYLQVFFNLNFNFDLVTPDAELPEIAATVTVNTNGQSSGVQLQTAFGDAAGNEMIRLLKSVQYWVPSQKDGKVIEDVLTLKMELFRNESNELAFGTPIIIRTNGK